VDAVDSDRVKHDAKLAAAGLGEITVLVHRTLKGVSPAPPPVSRVKDYKPVIEIAEKALKGQALSHGVA
jgi:hypothetical protein